MYYTHLIFIEHSSDAPRYRRVSKNGEMKMSGYAPTRTYRRVSKDGETKIPGFAPRRTHKRLLEDGEMKLLDYAPTRRVLKDGEMNLLGYAPKRTVHRRVHRIKTNIPTQVLNYGEISLPGDASADQLVLNDGEMRMLKTLRYYDALEKKVMILFDSVITFFLD